MPDGALALDDIVHVLKALREEMRDVRRQLRAFQQRLDTLEDFLEFELGVV